MALVRLNQWARAHYAPGSVPALATLRRRALAGDLPYYVEVQGRAIYIDPDRPVSQDRLVQSLIDRVMSDDAAHP